MTKRVMTNVILVSTLAVVLSSSVSWAYSKPLTYRQNGEAIVFKDEFMYSPHAWQIVKAIWLLKRDGYVQEAALAQKYLLPMLEGVTFNDVWGDADLAGASILDYYVPNATDSNFGFGAGFLSWDIFSLTPYKNSTHSFKTNAFYGYENAAEEAQYRYDYAKRIYLHDMTTQDHWGADVRDTMAGWVVDTDFGQDDPQDGNYAVGTAEIDDVGEGDCHSRFGDEVNCDCSTGYLLPATALIDLLQNHSMSQVVFPEQTDPALSTIYLPDGGVIQDHGGEWFDDYFCDADDVEAYNGYDGYGYAVYANWTLDAGGTCADGDDDCASPMIVRLPVDSKAHAFFQLGWAIHLLEDQTTPVHTSNSSYTTAQVHNDIEKRADEVIAPGSSVHANDGHLVENEIPALDLSTFTRLYQYPPSPVVIYDSDGNANTITCDAPDPAGFFKARWYTDTLDRMASADGVGEGMAHAYVRDTAEITHQFLDYIECTNTEIGREWSQMGFFTAYGLDLGVKSVAGLIRQYIEDVDKTPPTITITEPTATDYLHTGTLTLSWSVSDDESGIISDSVEATLDGMTTVGGHGLASGQTINLLDLSAGDHNFTVTAQDNALNLISRSVTFSIVVTAASIQDEVNQFVATGQITKNEGKSLLSKLTSAAKARAKMNCPNAETIYESFISEVNAQSGKSIDPSVATTLVGDAEYLITHCP